MRDRTQRAPRPTEVDLGICRATRFDRGFDAWVILLPGANYPTTAPLLWFAREAALAAGRNVLVVVDAYDGSDAPLSWAEQRAQAALAHVGESARPILVAKSITSLAAPLAARLGLPAVWLTPLIGAEGGPVSRAVIDGLAVASERCLLIGGSEDPSWDRARARMFERAEAIEIAGADHALQVPGDLHRSLDALRRVSSAVSDFIGAVDGTAGGGEPALTGLDHVQLAMPRGAEASAREFYGAVLGLREVPKPDPLVERGGCWFAGPGVHVHLGVADDVRPANKAHPAFRVRGLAALRERLDSARVAIEDDESLPGVRRLYTADPFGNRLEFIEDADAGFTER